MQYNSKFLFNLIYSILGRRQKSPYPDFTDHELINLLYYFFNDKISNIISLLPKPISITLISSTNNILTSFFLPSNDKLICLLTNSRSTSSLDPIPLKLLNDIAPHIISNIANIIHESLTSGTVPLIFKYSLIIPIIKKLSLDPLSFNNEIPISNISILSKVLEKVVSKQLFSYLTTNNILCTFQSAYVPNKSTETAITRVTNILHDLDNTYETIIILLDKAQHFIQLTIYMYIGASERYFIWGGAIYLYFILYILLCITNYILLISYTSLVYVNPLICN